MIAPRLGLVIFLLIVSWSAGGEMAADGSELPGAVHIVHTIRLQLPAPSDFYTHVADLNVYLTAQHSPSLARIEEELSRAQEKFDQCRILLRLDSVNYLAGPPLLSQWESMEFTRSLTPWERALFALTPPYSTGIVYVENLDWTIGRDGITAIGYAPFVETETDYLASGGEKAFFRTHIAGHAVLGRSGGRWTLAHELGHAIMDLRHAGDRNNVMFGGQLARGDAPRFDERQCGRGRANAPWIRPADRLRGDVLAAADAVGRNP